MTKEKIQLKTNTKSCIRCNDGNLDFIKVKCTNNGFKFFLKCNKCGYKEKRIEQLKIEPNTIHIEILHSNYYTDTNFWLIRKDKECYIIKSLKANIPDLDSLPAEIKEEDQERIESFFSLS